MNLSNDLIINIFNSYAILPICPDSVIVSQKISPKYLISLPIILHFPRISLIIDIYFKRKNSKNLALNANPISGWSRRNGASPMWSLIIRWKRGQTLSKLINWRRFRNLNASKSTSFGKSSKAPYFPHFFSPNSNLKTKACKKDCRKFDLHFTKQMEKTFFCQNLLLRACRSR